MKLVASFMPHIRVRSRAHTLTHKWINISEMKMQKQTPDAINANVLTPVTEHKYTTPVAKLVVGGTCNTASISRLYIFQIIMMSQKRTAHKTTATTTVNASTHRHRHYYCYYYHRRDRSSLYFDAYACVHMIELICMQSSIKVSGADIVGAAAS